MRLATVVTPHGTQAARIDEQAAVTVPGYSDVGELLNAENWRELAETAEGEALEFYDLDYAQLVPTPSKVLCVGLNYRNHILEMGRPLPEYPTLFAKFADSLTSPYADIRAVEEDPALDWEGELAVVIGKLADHVSEADANEYIAGFTIANDISMRTWQNRTNEWLQGKMWGRSTPIGPWLQTPDDFELETATIETRVNGETMQQSPLSDLLFTPAQLIAYASTIIPLRPGDIILTGTPGGVGHARDPKRYLAAGDVVEVKISGLGLLKNTII